MICFSQTGTVKNGYFACVKNIKMKDIFSLEMLKINIFIMYRNLKGNLGDKVEFTDQD